MPRRGGNKDKMNGIKILHAADLHLDSPFEGLPEGLAAKRRAEQRQLLGRIAELAARENVQLVLLSGDLLDSGSAYKETGEELVSALGSIPAPVFIAPGNHDYYSARSPYARLSWPENVHIFKTPNIECAELPESGVRVWGAGFTQPRCGGLLTGFEAEKAPDVLDVMCIHGEAGVRESAYNPVTADEIAASGMDYIAFGHIHKPSGLLRSGDTYYAWPGCPEGRGFDETGDRFVYVVSVGEGVCSVRPEKVFGRRYQIFKTDKSTAEEIAAELPEDCKNDVYRIILTGETDEAPNLDALRRALEDKFFALQLRDGTRIKQDVWERAGDDTLRGAFLRALRRRLDEAGDDDRRELIEQAARWGLAALDNREEINRHENK